MARPYYKVVGVSPKDPKANVDHHFIGRQCEFMGDVKQNEDKTYRGSFGFRDKYQIHEFEALELELWPEPRKDEEDIL